MKTEIINSIPVLTFSLFSNHPNIKCFAFSKLNGNLSISHADVAVFSNRKKILEAFKLDRFYEIHQVHGNEITEWNDLKDCDGIHTNTPMVPLFIKTADCQGAVFFDPQKKALALIHAGWRGQERKIYSETVSKLKARYGTDAKNLLVAIGPSIGAESFEFKENAPEYMHEHHIGRARYDLKEAAKKELLRTGVKEKNLEIAPECTFSDKRFFSHRREKTLSRQGILAWIV